VRQDPKKEPQMSEDESGELLVKEFDERTLGAARLHHLLLRETGIEDPWHTIVLAICAFDKLHLKDGWEFVLMHKRDIEEVASLYERSNSPEEFRDGLLELKERDLMEQLERRDLGQ
jgi:hypothetical protein